MEAGGQGVLAEVRQPQQGGEANAPHPAHQGPFLGLEPVGPDPLVAHQVQRLVLGGVIRLLEHGHIVGAARPEIAVLVAVDGVDLQPHHAEVLPGQGAGLADVLHAAHGAALAGEDQDLLHAGVGDDPHLVLDLLPVQLHALDVVVAVEAAVDAVVLTVVGDVQGREEVDRVAEVLPGLQPGPLGHLLQKRLRRRGEQGFEVLDGAGLVVQGRLHVPGGVPLRVVGVHLGDHLVHHVRLDALHAGEIGHVVRAAGGVRLQPVLDLQCLGAQELGVHKKLVFLIFHDVRPLSPAGSR